MNEFFLNAKALQSGKKIGCAVTHRIERSLQYSKIQQIISDERQAVMEENKVSFVLPCLKLCTYYDILFFSIKFIQLPSF